MRRELDLSDDRIVALAREGSEDAIRRAAGAALHRYLGRLYAHVRARLPADEAAVQDVLQEVALAVVQGLPRVRRGAALRAWLLRVASHKLCDHFRRRRRELRQADGVLGTALLEHLVDEQSSLERLLEKAGEEQLAAYVRRTLDRLKPRQREAVRLVYFEGMPLEAAARRLGLRADAVAALLYRARRAFARQVQRDRRAGVAAQALPLLAQVVNGAKAETRS